MKEVLENYFNTFNNYWNQKGLHTIFEKDDNIINILNFYIKNEVLHIDMSRSGWTSNYKFLIILINNDNKQVGYISLAQNECNVVYKNINESIYSFDQFTLNDSLDGYFSDSFNIKGNNIENITEFNDNGMFISNGVIPYLSNNLVSRFSEALSFHKNQNELLGQKRLVKKYN